MKRWIIHIDMDCFFASVEEMDDPSLVGKAIAVGGSPDKRGVIATANYEARKFGVRSALASRKAMELCPHLQIIHPRMSRYKEISSQVFSIFKEYSPYIQGLSLDEAYIDISFLVTKDRTPEKIAKEIRNRVEEEVGITCSAGIAPNKLLAKIASEEEKPNGQFKVEYKDIQKYIKEKPLKALPGIGKETLSTLKRFKLFHCKDFYKFSLKDLDTNLGEQGKSLFFRTRGISYGLVKNKSNRKSISIESTFAENKKLENIDLSKLLNNLKERINRFTNKNNNYKIYGITVKIKFSNFKQTTVSDSSLELTEDNCKKLLDKAWDRHRRSIRLVGIGVKTKKIEIPYEELQLQTEDYQNFSEEKYTSLIEKNINHYSEGVIINRENVSKGSIISMNSFAPVKLENQPFSMDKKKGVYLIFNSSDLLSYFGMPFFDLKEFIKKTKFLNIIIMDTGKLDKVLKIIKIIDYNIDSILLISENFKELSLLNSIKIKHIEDIPNITIGKFY